MYAIGRLGGKGYKRRLKKELLVVLNVDSGGRKE